MAEKSDEQTKKPRGRPPYKPTLEVRRIVEEMKFCGESENTIARAIGVDVETMRKHLADELADGHAARRKEVIGLLFEAARSGNVSAQKKLEEMSRSAGAAEAVARRGKAQPKLGKKEEQKLAAQRVGGKFTPPEPPKLVVDNKR